LQRHDAVEGDQRKDVNVEDRVLGREATDPGFMLHRRGRAMIVVPRPPLVLEATFVRRGSLDQIHIRHHVGPYQLPTQHCQGKQAQAKPGEHEIVRQPDRLGVLELVQRSLHRTINGVVTRSENENESQERDRQEGHRGFGEPDDHA
jgi:hypothetical protein